MTRALTFLTEVRSELAKVTWPTRAQTTRMTLIVIVMSVAMGAFIGGLDYLLTNLFGVLIK